MSKNKIKKVKSVNIISAHRIDNQFEDLECYEYNEIEDLDITPRNKIKIKAKIVRRNNMNREIKFRAWDKKEMFSVARIDISDGSCYRHLFAGECYDYWNNVELMQYIGLNDRQGRKIYEGDIVEIVDAPTLHPCGCYIGTKFKVFYNQESCAFMMQDIFNKNNTQYFDLDLDGIPPEYLEVIGNIYENPELLEREK